MLTRAPKRERCNVQAVIRKTDISTLSPPRDETTLVHELVAQFLSHDGYVETAQAFTQEVRNESRILGDDREDYLRQYEAGEDIDALNRQRRSVLFCVAARLQIQGSVAPFSLAMSIKP